MKPCLNLQLACPNSSARRAWGSEWKVGNKARNVVSSMFSACFNAEGECVTSSLLGESCKSISADHKWTLVNLNESPLLAQWMTPHSMSLLHFSIFFLFYYSALVYVGRNFPSSMLFTYIKRLLRKKECNRWGLKYSRSPVIKNIPSWIRANGSN